MIVRTYQRRHRGLGRSLTDPGLSFGDVESLRDSCSQDSPWPNSQEHLPYSFSSSQDSAGWSQTENGSSGLPLSVKGSDKRGHDDVKIDSPTPSLLQSSQPPRTSLQKSSHDTSKTKQNEKLSPGQKLKRAESSFSALNAAEANKIKRGRMLEAGKADGPCGTRSSASESRENPVSGTSLKNASVWGPCAPPTSTLMEAQESGEMMEHVDEANFAMDGLRPGQPLRIQRASLISLLSICGSTQRRRLLRTHGMVKPILDAIIALPNDDPSTALAAATLLYAVASDGQDEHLLDSSTCIQFLLHLLVPCQRKVEERNLPSVGSRLLGVNSKQPLQRPDTELVGVYGGGAAMVAKVTTLLASTKEKSFQNIEDEQIEKWPIEELSSQWLALLTLEKACLSTVMLEDSSGSVRRVGGHFKETLRELGGLDAVCDLAASCILNIREAVKGKPMINRSLQRSGSPVGGFGGAGMLLRCLKVMENVTFLSEKNQRHLLDMMLCNEKLDSPGTFVGLIISAIRLLSELVLRHKNGDAVFGGQPGSATGNTSNLKTRKLPLNNLSKPVSTECQDQKDVKGSRDPNCQEVNRKLQLCPTGTTPLKPKHRHRETSKLLGLQDGGTGGIVKNQSCSEQSGKQIAELSKSFKRTVCDNGEVRNFCSKQSVLTSKANEMKRSMNDTENNHSRKKLLMGSDKRKLESKKNVVTYDSQDPFDFDDEEMCLGQGNTLGKPSRRCKGKVDMNFALAGDSFGSNKGQEATEGIGVEDLGFNSGDSAKRLDERLQEGVLLEDCLLSAVKVLMNLTNDNAVGCCQVATCGGLDTMAFLILRHYPILRSSHSLQQDHIEKFPHELEEGTNGSQCEQDLDLLVVVLGVLVNLVEKDIRNRARLATLSVDVPSLSLSSNDLTPNNSKGIIALLCSIFLSKEGAGEAAEAIGGKLPMEIDDEDVFKQEQREAEDMIVEAYAALLLAFLSQESENARFVIAQHLPGKDLQSLVPVLERFVAFHLSLNMMSSETHAAVRSVIDSCKQPS